MLRLSGYQRLEQDFFRLCRIRKIKHSAMLLFIYLRGLYCRFGKSIFYFPDRSIIQDLGISKMQLNRLRKYLQERGIIEYRSFHGRGKVTEYSILNTELAPARTADLEIKGNKMLYKRYQNVTFSLPNLSTKRYQNVTPRVIQSKEQSKEKRFNIPKDWKEETLERIGQ